MDVVVIDEASMISPKLFDQFEQLCRSLRKVDLPFGGMQIILSGDFFQLPPVYKSSRQELLSLAQKKVKEAEEKISYSDNGTELNDSSALCSFENAKTHNIDTQPPSMLAEAIMGLEYKHELHPGYIKKIETQTKYLFEAAAWRRLMQNGLKTVVLNEAFRQRDPKFIALLDDLRSGVCSTQMWEYMSNMSNTHKNWDPSIIPTLLSGHRKVVDERNNFELAKIKSRLRTFTSIDSVKVPSPEHWPFFAGDATESVNQEFDAFQANLHLYLKVGAQVILIRNLSHERKLVNGSRGMVVGFIQVRDQLLQTMVDLPLVEFQCGNRYLIGFHEFNSNYGTSEDAVELQLKRIQIPLKLGWALTIHKSQGMTLDRVIIDLPHAFAPGHAYVAMSRVRHPDGLSISKFGEGSVYVSGKVLKFYKELGSGNC